VRDHGVEAVEVLDAADGEPGPAPRTGGRSVIEQ